MTGTEFARKRWSGQTLSDVQVIVLITLCLHFEGTIVFTQP